MRFFLRLMLLIASLGLVQACAPFSRDLSFDLLEARYGGGAAQYVALEDGTRLRYRVEGQGPTLVALHGFGASSDTWSPWSQQLRDRYRIIAFDLLEHGLTRTPRGHDLSLAANAETIGAALRALNVERYAIVGHSMGGAVALRLALQNPDKVEAIILVAPAVRLAEGEAPRGGGPWVFNNPVGRTLAQIINPRPIIGAGLRDAIADDRAVDGAMIGRYADFARAPGRRSALVRARAAPGFERADLERVSAPILILHGAQDDT